MRELVADRRDYVRAYILLLYADDGKGSVNRIYGYIYCVDPNRRLIDLDIPRAQPRKRCERAREDVLIRVRKPELLARPTCVHTEKQQPLCVY